MTTRSRIVLTNDDGIDAPGLAALERAADSLGGEVAVVAPEECHSGGGHRVTTHRPVAVREVGPGRYAVAGTPADCTRLALATIVPGLRALAQQRGQPVLLEASGVEPDQLVAYAHSGIDLISTSAPITRSPWMDISMRFVPTP